MTPDIYLDANATSAVLPAAIAAADEAMRVNFGNPSSTHASGLRARALLDATRACARRVLGAGDGKLTFTSGATESIQTAVLSALCAVRARRAAGETTGDLLIYGATEHKAVPESLAHWNMVLGTNLELRALPVDAHGQHRLDLLQQWAPRAAMVCTMAANNETGVVSDLAAIRAVLQQHGSRAYWMVDSVQALGKLALDLANSGIDYAPFSGHKLYAPKGIGMLYVRAGAPYTPLMAGGGQEAGLRSGTENMAGIAALGAVLAALERGDTFRSHADLTALRARVADALRSALPGIVFNAPLEKTLPTTLNFSVPGLSNKELLDVFDASGVRVSAGSACSSAKSAPSYVLEAMAVPQWACGAAVRLSFGPLSDDGLIDAACARIARCGEALRSAGMLVGAAASAVGSSGVGALAVRDGVVQFSADGYSGWVVVDGGSRSCVVIDAPPQLVEKIGAFVRAQALRVRAVLNTRSDAALTTARCALVYELAGQLEPVGNTSPLGWPQHSDCVTLANGMLVNGIALGGKGGQILVRVPQNDGDFDKVVYLLGHVDDGQLAAAAVRWAFTGLAAQDGGPAFAARFGALLHPYTVLCCARDAQDVFCSTLAAGAGASAPDAASVAALGAAALQHLLAAHADAIVVDVREQFEHDAADVPAWMGRNVVNVPLSRLVTAVPDWLGGARPLVFFCRSGNRSARALLSLQRVGRAQVFHLAGGIALANPAAEGPALALAA